jgi:hypothetical protein
MPPDIKHIVSRTWEPIASFGKEKLPVLTAAEQTRLSWARRVKSYDDLPELYKGFFDALPPHERNQFPYTVLTPTFKGFRKPENEKLICMPGERVCVLESIENKVLPVCYPLADINYVEAGAILLYAWITINGLDEQGQLASSTLKFSAVTDSLLAPYVESMRPRISEAREAYLWTETDHFDSLANTNFKFMSYAKKSIRPGEKVIQSLFQPEIRTELFKLYAVTISRSVSPAHLSILTDSELIIIRDDESQRWLQGVRNGGIWTYIPLSKVSSVSLSHKEQNLLVLSICLPENQHVDCLFQDSRKGKVERLLSQLELVMVN